MKPILLLVPAVLLAALPAPAALIASWRLDESSGNVLDETGGVPAGVPLNDSATYGNPGVPNGSYGGIAVANASGTSIGFGPSTTDTQFIAGTDNNNPVLNLAPSGSLTVMGWLQPAAPVLTTSFTYRLLSTGTNAGAGRGWGLGLRYTIAGDVTTTHVRFTGYGIADKDSAAVDITTGEWYHLAATYDNGTTALYLNGELVNVHADVRAFGDEPAEGRLVLGGRMGGSNAEQTSGLVDGIRVYNSVLTSAEIAAAAADSVSLVPEPSVAALAALAVPALFRRRRMR